MSRLIHFHSLFTITMITNTEPAASKSVCARPYVCTPPVQSPSYRVPFHGVQWPPAEHNDVIKLSKPLAGLDGTITVTLPLPFVTMLFRT